MSDKRIPTPHIAAKEGDFASTVLMPGDPKRSAYIARTFLSDCTPVNDVRGVQGYTGTFEGKRVSVMASGMGMPSMGIYSHELFNFYGVEAIIRVGSAGAISPALKVRDVVLGQAACTDSAYAAAFSPGGSFAPIADFELLSRAYETAKQIGLNVTVGNLLSSDVFYTEDDVSLRKWQKMGVLAVEMESAALYTNALRSGKKALCICTVSDCPLGSGSLSASERETSFNDMCILALKTAI